VTLLVWLLAIVVAYPFVPGSQSTAFKGVSVFIGILATLGSSGVVGHMVSGLVLVYSRALRRGDFVRTIVSEAGFPVMDAANEVSRAVQTFIISAEEAKRLAGEVGAGVRDAEVGAP